jgi:hypothetical protein
MYIESVPNRNSPPAVLLRESYRENGKVRKRTLCNLSDWPAAHIEGLRGVLKGGTVIAAERDAIERNGVATSGVGRRLAAASVCAQPHMPRRKNSTRPLRDSGSNASPSVDMRRISYSATMVESRGEHSAAVFATRACTHCAGHDGSDSSFSGGLGSWRSCFG